MTTFFQRKYVLTYSYFSFPIIEYYDWICIGAHSELNLIKCVFKGVAQFTSKTFKKNQYFLKFTLGSLLGIPLRLKNIIWDVLYQITVFFLVYFIVLWSILFLISFLSALEVNCEFTRSSIFDIYKHRNYRPILCISTNTIVLKI